MPAATVPPIQSVSSTPMRPSWRASRARMAAGDGLFRCRLIAGWMLTCCVGLTAGAFAQDQPPPASPASSPASSNPAAPAQSIPRVVTTVTVHDEAKDNYLPETVTAGTLEGAPLRETPVSVTV